MLVGGLIARKNAAKLQGGIKNCGLLVFWLLKGAWGRQFLSLFVVFPLSLLEFKDV